MSKKDELQAQRNELFSHSSDTLARIKELDEQIAEVGKSKLRHGNYGLRTKQNNRPILAVKNSPCKGNNIVIAGSEFTFDYGNDEEGDFSQFGGIVLGNIFDDLTAMQEDVESFEVEDEEGDKISPRITGSNIYIDSEGEESGEMIEVRIVDVPAFILGLQQMHATLQRKGAAK